GLEAKRFAHRQIGGACCAGGEEKDDRPARSLCGRIDQVLHEKPTGQGQQSARGNIREGDHDSATMRVEKSADQHWAKEISDGEWKEIQTDPIGRDTLKADQNTTEGAPNPVVEKY